VSRTIATLLAHGRFLEAAATLLAAEQRRREAAAIWQADPDAAARLHRLGLISRPESDGGR
jgi:hypothetical protein